MAAQQVRASHPLVWLFRGVAVVLFLGVLAGLILNWPQVVADVSRQLSVGGGANSFTTTPSPPIASATHAASPEPAATPAPPRLLIPAFNVDEPVIPNPIRDKQWDISGLDKQVGWLTSTGARPGDDFAMVLIGHITVRDYTRGAFADLEAARAGLQVLYQAEGVEYVYEVTQRGRVAPDDVTGLYVPNGNVLLLMTCTDWDGANKTYANRLLVRAELKEQRAVP
ncbi:MAG: sortase [Anaerolineales bacterium]